MGYLNEFKEQIYKRNPNKLLMLWEEYCLNDILDVDELVTILELIKESDFSDIIGSHIEDILPLYETIEAAEEQYRALTAIIDIETNNSSTLAEKALEALNSRYGNDEAHLERLRLVGLRDGATFKGALSNYALLMHMAVGNCVYNRGGWGTGEIVSVSQLLEQISVEFEHAPGRKSFTFLHAFKNLIPLSADHFLTRRFIDADALEAEARDNPMAVIKLLLKDLGPKTAAEIKDELCELVIPEGEWTRWWQAARNKLKKDTLITLPNTLRDPFILRSSALTHEERLENEIAKAHSNFEVILTAYNFIRDFPHVAKKDTVKNALNNKLKGLLEDEETTTAERLQIYLFVEQLFDHPISEDQSVAGLIQETAEITPIIEVMEIQAFKKRALIIIREQRDDWASLFLSLLSTLPQSTLRDYIFNELLASDAKETLIAKLEELLATPAHAPDLTFWYANKILSSDSNSPLPFSDKEGQCRFAEALLVLLHTIEHTPSQRELTKKIHAMLTHDRYAAVRKILEGSSAAFAQELLLLASKSHQLAGQDLTIFHSLAKVVHPTLADDESEENLLNGTIIWTSEEAYQKTQEHAQQIGSVEIVKNAKEVEAARALGDLSENAEYKFAMERRRQLQGELKQLLDQINRARIITDHDISLNEVGIGNSIDIVDEEGQQLRYTILGPWDADADKRILSFQSKLAQAMVGRKVGDTFSFKEKRYTVSAIHSFLHVTP